MSDKNASTQSVDLSDLGGKQIIGPFVAIKTENPISLEDLGGIRLGQHPSHAPEISDDSDVVDRTNY